MTSEDSSPKPACPECSSVAAQRFDGLVAPLPCLLQRECLDHIIVFNESSLRRILKSYFDYYEHSRTHLALSY